MANFVWGFNDFRVALRALRKSPGFTAVAVLTLALGIGGTTAFFSVIDTALLRPLPFPQTERLVRLRATLRAASGGTYLANLVPRDVDFLGRRSQSFDAITAQRVENFTLIGAGDPVRLAGASISPGSLNLLGISPVLGRGFTPEEERSGDVSGVVLISHRLWQDRFAGDPAIVGTALRLTDRVVTIVGVLAAGFDFPYRADIWQPLTIQPSDQRDLLVLARLRPERTLAGARTEMANLMGELRVLDGESTASLPVDVTRLRDDLVRDQEGTTLLLFAAAALFLLMACVNLTSLLLARAVARQRDFALRGALGASRRKLIVAVIGEPLIIAVLGAGVALVALRWAGPALVTLVPQVLSQELGVEPVSLNWHVAVFAAVVAVGSALVAALAPALYSSRDGAATLLRSTGTASRSSGHRPLRALLVSEIALLCVLLLSAGAVIEGFVHVSRARLGFEPRNLLAIEIDPPRSRYDDSLKVRHLVENIQNEVALLPGSRVAVTTINPLRGATGGTTVRPDSASPQEAVTVNLRMVSSGLFDTEGIALLRGRDFTRADAQGPPVTVVSRRLARHFWGREDVVGKRLVRSARGDVSVATTVVGVADDVEDAGDLRETAYFPLDQLASLAAEGSIWVMIRGQTGRGGWIRDVERAIHRVDPDLAWRDLGAMDTMRFEATARERLGTSLAGAFGMFAVLLAGLGLAGVMTFILGQREAEIGVRRALGADARMIVRLVTGEGLRVALFGVGVGLLSFLVAWPLAAHLVTGLRVPGAITFAIAVGLILGVSACAALVPALRASRLDPRTALRRC